MSDVLTPVDIMRIFRNNVHDNVLWSLPTDVWDNVRINAGNTVWLNVGLNVWCNCMDNFNSNISNDKKLSDAYKILLDNVK